MSLHIYLKIHFKLVCKCYIFHSYTWLPITAIDFCHHASVLNKVSMDAIFFILLFRLLHPFVLFSDLKRAQRLRFPALTRALRSLTVENKSILVSKSLYFSWCFLEMGPDPTRAYFWPTVNKRPTRLWPGYFPTRPEAIFFDPKGKKLKNLTFLEEIFEIQTQTINGWPGLTRPEPQKIDPTRPGSKIFEPDPSLMFSDFCMTKVAEQMQVESYIYTLLKHFLLLYGTLVLSRGKACYHWYEINPFKNFQDVIKMNYTNVEMHKL